MGSHVLKAFFYIDAVKADKIRRKSYEKTIVIGNIVTLYAVDNGADGRVCGEQRRENRSGITSGLLKML